MTLEELGYKLIEKDGKYYYNGSLDLIRTSITTLPNNLTIGGGLFLAETNITSFPNNLTVGGSLDLMNTEITSLPNNLTVGGNLYLNGTKITSLPDNLIVGRSLNIEDTKVTSLPNNLVVGGNIFFGNTKITKEEIERVNHNVPKVLFWKNKEYVRVNGLFYRVLSYKESIYEISWIGDDRTKFLIANRDCNKYIIRDNLEVAKEKYNLLNIKNK